MWPLPMMHWDTGLLPPDKTWHLPPATDICRSSLETLFTWVPYWYWLLVVVTETRAVGKRAVHILLECILVPNVSTVSTLRIPKVKIVKKPLLLVCALWNCTGIKRVKIITARKRSLGQGNIFTPFLSFCSQGGSTWAGTPQDQVHSPGPGTPPPDQVHPPVPDTPPGTRYTPRIRYTPGTRYTPWDQVHTPQTRYTPPLQSMLGDTVNAWAVRILLECKLVKFMLSQCINGDGSTAWYIHSIASF